MDDLLFLLIFTTTEVKSVIAVTTDHEAMRLVVKRITHTLGSKFRWKNSLCSEK